MTGDTMRAARFDRASGQLTVADVPVPEPGPWEVLVRVGACGICLSEAAICADAVATPYSALTDRGGLRPGETAGPDLSRSVSEVVPLEDVSLGVQRLRSKEGNPVRIVVKP